MANKQVIPFTAMYLPQLIKEVDIYPDLSLSEYEIYEWIILILKPIVKAYDLILHKAYLQKVNYDLVKVKRVSVNYMIIKIKQCLWNECKKYGLHLDSNLHLFQIAEQLTLAYDHLSEERSTLTSKPHQESKAVRENRVFQRVGINLIFVEKLEYFEKLCKC